MTFEQIDARKEYVQKARASFETETDDWTHSPPEKEEPAFGKSFFIRLTAGALLFLLFVLADITQFQFGNYTTQTIAQSISRETIVPDVEIMKEHYTNLEKYVMMLIAE
ncbi:MAG: hypothetical protein J6B28_00825 [Eubacterium sp.]|nr:hypothetical protein [Eubacterium sp.]